MEPSAGAAVAPPGAVDGLATVVGAAPNARVAGLAADVGAAPNANTSSFLFFVDGSLGAALKSEDVVAADAPVNEKLILPLFMLSAGGAGVVVDERAGAAPNVKVSTLVFFVTFLSLSPTVVTVSGAFVVGNPNENPPVTAAVEDDDEVGGAPKDILGFSAAGTLELFGVAPNENDGPPLFLGTDDDDAAPLPPPTTLSFPQLIHLIIPSALFALQAAQSQLSPPPPLPPPNPKEIAVLVVGATLGTAAGFAQ